MPGMPPQMMAMMQHKGSAPLQAMMAKGMIPGKGPMAMPPRPPTDGSTASTPAGPGAPLSAAALAAAPPAMQKQMLGEKLYPEIAKYQPELAGKITGMMLEMDNSELLILLESESQLKNKVDEALRVLEPK